MVSFTFYETIEWSLYSGVFYYQKCSGGHKYVLQINDSSSSCILKKDSLHLPDASSEKGGHVLELMYYHQCSYACKSMIYYHLSHSDVFLKIRLTIGWDREKIQVEDVGQEKWNELCVVRTNSQRPRFHFLPPRG